MSSADPIWKRLEAELRSRVDASTYEIWLAPLRFGGVDGNTVVLLAPAEVRGWLRQRGGSLIQDAADAALGEPAVLELRDSDDAAASPAARPAPAHEVPPSPIADEPARLNPRYTFDQFVIGDGNRFAHAAALAVAELPAQAYNPLFIVGPPGTGKTHLLHAIGNYVRAYGGGLAVRYTTVEHFTNEFIAALRSRDVESFKRAYRRNDVLLIDDVQFLESKVKTEEEFFHTFNALHGSGGQLVLTSDRPPRDIARLHERLRERFESGLLVDVASPDHATRMTILRKRVRHDAIPIAEDGVLELLAERVTANVRALEGALIRVVAFASLTNEPITCALAERVLADLYGRDAHKPGRPRVKPQAITIERIQQLVAERFGLTRDELLSPSRAARVAWPRQIAMYLAREHTQESLPAIGASFAGRDHTTVLYACRRTARRMSDDPEAFDAVRSLTESLGVTDVDRSC